MIELLSKERCISCNQCVSVCPTNVFERTTDGIPVIARQSDCQSCFMCELYCPTDALYVAPLADEQTRVDESELIDRGLLGSYRENLGWGKGRKSTASADGSYIIFQRMRASH
ncbi:NAD-dependent dihydropyrimidine dehydrogenase, PreA subunit [Paenibacillus sp. UNCCL117]|uniref:4Fe-4S dicluster domain-containing protein n=1 Tax=unclassified Paenibacillus TaxID=185978 RepID=UPI000890CC2E|nr:MULTISPECIES: ferredoxin family protein [unclassified Paenibacillus]SDD57591.1 NAD-dependent dihydropyrimidine dehydrogenase, PreA subunit [Paenibacillus sp. cl123]SFW51156.1 NAD-dependent dihydropyrimidine dehydrogenase, PreA subunit [Paenibacillus sp. UNCCL117]